MSQRQFRVSLPDEVLEGFDWNDADVPAGVLETLVMELLRRDRISEADAARVLNLDRWQLLDAMARHAVPAVRLTADELSDELAS